MKKRISKIYNGIPDILLIYYAMTYKFLSYNIIRFGTKVLRYFILINCILKNALFPYYITNFK